jgi:hypothetical protein
MTSPEPSPSDERRDDASDERIDLSGYRPFLTPEQVDSDARAREAAQSRRRERQRERAAAEGSPIGAAPSASFFGWTYIVAVVVGLVPVFVSHQAWMVPLAVMVAYAAVGYARAIKTGTIFEFSDSIYYLGFTLSVGALLASLEPFRSDKTPDPTQIFHLFGLGMLTTLFGVVARTSLQTFHRLPSETVEVVNDRLTAEARRYVERLAALNDDIDKVLTRTATSFDERVTPKLATIETALQTSLEQFTSTASVTAALAQRAMEANSALETMVASYRQGTDAVLDANTTAAQSARELATALDAAATSTSGPLAAGLQQLASRAESARTALDAFTEDVNAISIDLTPLTTPIAKVGEAIEGAASAALGEVSALRIAVAELTHNADEVRRASLSMATPDLARRLTELEAELEQLAKATRSQRELSDAELLTLRSHVEATLTNARDLSSALEEITTVAMQRLRAMTAPGDAGRNA